MSTVAPLKDERGEDVWTFVEAVRTQYHVEKRTGSITVQIHIKRGTEVKVMLTPLQVAYMAGDDEAEDLLTR